MASSAAPLPTPRPHHAALVIACPSMMIFWPTMRLIKNIGGLGRLTVSPLPHWRPRGADTPARCTDRQGRIVGSCGWSLTSRGDGWPRRGESLTARQPPTALNGQDAGRGNHVDEQRPVRIACRGALKLLIFDVVGGCPCRCAVVIVARVVVPRCVANPSHGTFVVPFVADHRFVPSLGCGRDSCASERQFSGKNGVSFTDASRKASSQRAQSIPVRSVRPRSTSALVSPRRQPWQAITSSPSVACT